MPPLPKGGGMKKKKKYHGGHNRFRPVNYYYLHNRKTYQMNNNRHLAYTQCLFFNNIEKRCSDLTTRAMDHNHNVSMTWSNLPTCCIMMVSGSCTNTECASKSDRSPGSAIITFFNHLQYIEHIDRLVQEIRNSSALAIELRFSCTNPLISYVNRNKTTDNRMGFLTWCQWQNRYWEWWMTSRIDR